MGATRRILMAVGRIIRRKVGDMHRGQSPLNALLILACLVVVYVPIVWARSDDSPAMGAWDVFYHSWAFFYILFWTPVLAVVVLLAMEFGMSPLTTVIYVTLALVLVSVGFDEVVVLVFPIALITAWASKFFLSPSPGLHPCLKSLVRNLAYVTYGMMYLCFLVGQSGVFRPYTAPSHFWQIAIGMGASLLTALLVASLVSRLLDPKSFAGAKRLRRAGGVVVTAFLLSLCAGGFYDRYYTEVRFDDPSAVDSAPCWITDYRQETWWIFDFGAPRRRVRVRRDDADCAGLSSERIVEEYQYNEILRFPFLRAFSLELGPLGGL